MATSTMDSESTSRSSVNDFSSLTSAASTSATSFRISASPARISSGEVATWLVPFWLGSENYLAGVGEPGPEAQQQHRCSGRDLAALDHLGQRERDRRGRGVARYLNVSGHDRVR